MAWKIQRDDIMDYVTYTEQRDQIQERVFAAKQPRRIHLGDSLTFLFENHETMCYQVQEIARAEQIVKESALQHEIDVYNSLLADAGELACALLIEIGDGEVRRQKLTDWLELPKHVYVKLDDGTKVYAKYDAGQVGDDRLSAVQYLRFRVGERAPVAIGTDLPDLALEQELSEAQRQALANDLQAASQTSN